MFIRVGRGVDVEQSIHIQAMMSGETEILMSLQKNATVRLEVRLDLLWVLRLVRSQCIM